MEVRRGGEGGIVKRKSVIKVTVNIISSKSPFKVGFPIGIPMRGSGRNKIFSELLGIALNCVQRNCFAKAFPSVK